ncbi:MAG: ATP-binding protein [Gemmatimonadota bacterium]
MTDNSEQQPQTQDLTVRGDPTKDFFIHILTKDVELIDAIIDLVDNSLDGARRLRGGLDSDYSGLTIAIEASDERFKISDNCGGIPVDTARKYAFRFGRPPEMSPTEYSVGQFGVGMKRALFKIGRAFRIDSRAQDSTFLLSEDVEEWTAKPDDWSFQFDELDEHTSVPLDQTGTDILIEPLHPAVKIDFANEKTIYRMRRQLGVAHWYSIDRHLSITVNGEKLTPEPLTLLRSSELVPVNKVVELPANNGVSVTARIFAGLVSEARQPTTDAGWYIFCNGRLVLPRDQTRLTGWGESGVETIPRFHPQFARFRGYALLESANAALLPWNTSKTGVDENSPVYRHLLSELLKVMRSIITFLNRLDKEFELPEEDRPLQEAVKHAEDEGEVRLEDLSESDAFVSPTIPAPQPAPKAGRIMFYRPPEQIEEIKTIIKATSNRAVGEATFDYFYKRECSD